METGGSLMSALPSSVPYLVVGAGVHGLSTAYHLALELKKRGRVGSEILLVDKTGVGAGVSGIACGVIRCNYFQLPMRDIMAHSVAVWESDPEAFNYHPVGYMQISPEPRRSEVATVFDRQQEIGYPSELIEGKQNCMRYMRDLFSDWRAEGITCVLHEKKGGYAHARNAMEGLAGKARAEGVRIETAVRVTGFDVRGGAVSSVETDQGSIDVGTVVIGAGPWIHNLWELLELPVEIDVKSNGTSRRMPMWNYWCLVEGTLGVDPTFQYTNDGKHPPVIRLETDAPLYSDLDGSLLREGMWGAYFKPDFYFGGVQGGAAPYRVEDDPADIDLDDPDRYLAGDDFAQMWCSALAFCMERFEGKYPLYKKAHASGGLGSFSPDNFPVFDVFHQNCHVIADSNHGFKMIGVGKLVAEEIMGRRSALLEPFRFSRFAEGKLLPTTKSPFPWT
jgi:methylglutamate dehydrogenase subunit A